MPIYEYTCEDCDEKFEKLVRLSDKNPDIRCPKCGSRKTKKGLSMFGVGSSAGGGSCSTTPT